MTRTQHEIIQAAMAADQLIAVLVLGYESSPMRFFKKDVDSWQRPLAKHTVRDNRAVQSMRLESDQSRYR